MSTARISAAVTPRVLPASYRHLANRFTFGINETVAADMRAAGSAKKWFEKQLAWSSLTDTAAGAAVGWFPALKDAPGEAWAMVKKGDTSAWQYGFDFASYTMARKVLARRQVHEVMVDFWSNLLYIPAGEDRSFPWRYSYDNAIRKYALGSFRSLLRTAVVHPAMSGWLNNSDNTKQGINENLGRELLELYTVGRPSGYDESDVKNSARLLTGYKVRVFEDFAASYDRNRHYTGPVSVLGFRHKNSSTDGRAAVNAYLDYLARHPSTANRVARRLCTRFVADTPSTQIVAAVASAYRKSDTDIKATLRALVAHPHFAGSAGRKVRTPVEDVVNVARVLGMRPTGATKDDSFARHVIWMSASMGQKQFDWPRPDGFPETSTTWTSPARLLRTWNMHYSLAGNWWGSADLARTPRKDQLPTAWPRTMGELVDHQSRMLLGRPATTDLVTLVASMTNTTAAYSFRSAAEVSDWWWTVIRGAVLNRPEGMLR